MSTTKTRVHAFRGGGGRAAPRFTLRALEPSESEVQAGILRLAGVHHAVELAVRVNAGDFCIVRPPGGDWRALGAQITRCVDLGLLARGQIGWVRGAPRDTPDILGVMAGGAALAVEAKRPGGSVRSGQRKLITRLAETGACAAVIDGIDHADKLFTAWGKRHDQR